MSKTPKEQIHSQWCTFQHSGKTLNFCCWRPQRKSSAVCVRLLLAATAVCDGGQKWFPHSQEVEEGPVVMRRGIESLCLPVCSACLL